MRIPVSLTRWGAATAIAAALLASAATSAGATTRTAAPAPVPAAQPAWSIGDYHGVQGGNLCLLSRCTVGTSDNASGSTGPSNTQGFNLCLLALCTVRP
ncbi:hypothetical protein [Streptomyces sp. 150FB]|uniref:hypothetical protein n=1 Tax=Streptomyces sp. 150FB TaxID=1576605 RepID=UPI00099C9645|nr:hypothetical protein [Streptomyces sp. 150FB]